MGLTLLGPIDHTQLRLGYHGLIVKEVEWLWEVREGTNDKIRFFHFFMHFLSHHERSANAFVGSAISITHFARVCALRVWRDILVLGQPLGSEIREYVHSAIANVLLDNILHRLLLYSYHVMNILISGDAPSERSYKLANEMIIQNIKVSQIPML